MRNAGGDSIEESINLLEPYVKMHKSSQLDEVRMQDLFYVTI